MTSLEKVEVPGLLSTKCCFNKRKIQKNWVM